MRTLRANEHQLICVSRTLHLSSRFAMLIIELVIWSGIEQAFEEQSEVNILMSDHIRPPMPGWIIARLTDAHDSPARFGCSFEEPSSQD